MRQDVSQANGAWQALVTREGKSATNNNSVSTGIIFLSFFLRSPHACLRSTEKQTEYTCS